MIYSRHSLGPGRVIRKTVIRKTGQAVFFHDPGCTDCENADELLDEMQKTFPYLRIDKYDLNTNAGIDLNESLCHRFNVSERHRMFTPSVFAGSGYLAGEDINYESLGDMIRRSVLVPRLKPDVPVATEKEQETVEKNGQNYRWKYFFMVLCLAVVAGFVFMKKDGMCQKTEMVTVARPQFQQFQPATVKRFCKSFLITIKLKRLTCKQFQPACHQQQ